MCSISQIIHQASSSRAWCSVAQKHWVLSGGAALFSTEPLQPSKHWFYLSQIGVSDETYRFTSAKHTPEPPLGASGANRWFHYFHYLKVFSVFFYYFHYCSVFFYYFHYYLNYLSVFFYYFHYLKVFSVFFYSFRYSFIIFITFWILFNSGVT
jgi:hypothetical protein